MILQQTPEPNIWQMVVNPDVEGLRQVCGVVMVYVDDVVVMSERSAAESFMKRLNQEWQCSAVQWVGHQEAVRFCGLELMWKDENLLISQQQYVRELLERYPEVEVKTVPMPKFDLDVEEPDATPKQVKAAQTITGEVMWLTQRARPDLAFPTAWMSKMVTKCPGWRKLENMSSDT